MIVCELSSLILELDGSFPLCEKPCLLDAVSLGDGTLSEFAEAAHARLKHIELSSKAFQEGLNLIGDHILRHFLHIIEANLDHSFRLTKSSNQYRIVHDVGEFLVRDGADLMWIKRSLLVVSAHGDLFASTLRHLASFSVADVGFVPVCPMGLHLIS